MPRKRKINLPLIEVFLISLAFHVLVLFALGGLTIYRSMMHSAVDFESAPPPERVQPQQQQVQVRMQQQQRQSSRPRQTMTVQNVSDMNVPQVEVQVPAMSSRIATPMGGTRGTVASNLGSGRIGLEKSSVNFFGIKSEGERVTFIIDASRYMMQDEKGGMNAYRIVKEEIIEMIDNLAPATLFNVILYEYSNRVTVFRPTMVPATTPNKQAFAEWLRPLNEDPENLGARIGEPYSIQQPFEPILGSISRHWRAFHAAMELQTDAIFFITGGWSNRLLQPYPEGFDVAEWRRKQGWNEEKAQAYTDAIQRARDWLEKENKAREAKGMPPMVVQHIHSVLRNNLNDDTPSAPNPPRSFWEEDDLMRYFQRLGRFLYPGERNPSPEMNVIVFRGKDEPWTEAQDTQVSNFVRRNRGTHRVLEGLEGVQAVTGRE